MKFSTFAILATGASAAAVSGWASNETDVSYTTEIVTKLTTYCPEATKITHAGKTYTVTEATTLTITDCPCTLTKPVWTSTSAKKTSTAEWKSESTWKAESSTKKTSTEEWKSESTWKAASTWAAETPKTTEAPKTTSVWKAQNATSTSEVAKFTGAANALNAAGAGVVGVAALFAAVL